MARLHLEADSEELGAKPDNPAAILPNNGTWTYEELSPVTYVRAGLPPIFVAHGADDQVVPVSHSQDLVDRLRAVAATVSRSRRRGPRVARRPVGGRHRCPSASELGLEISSGSRTPNIR